MAKTHINLVEKLLVKKHKYPIPTAMPLPPLPNLSEYIINNPVKLPEGHEYPSTKIMQISEFGFLAVGVNPAILTEPG